MSISELENLIGRAGEAGNFAAVGKLEKLIEARQSPTPAKPPAARKKAVKPAAPVAPQKSPTEKVAAQRARVVALINNFRGQGMTDAQIASQLRTLRVPGPLVADLLA